MNENENTIYKNLWHGIMVCFRRKNSVENIYILKRKISNQNLKIPH
jgi:hypothetical protein